MPSITIDSYWTMYHELADRVYDFSEWGLNRSGRRSHTSRPGDCAQYDANRVNVFNPLGTVTNTDRTIAHRILPAMGLEGPHETAGELVFCLPTAQAVFTNAQIRLYPIELPNTTIPFRLYGVASDNFCSRFVAPTYPATYKGEWQQVTYGASHYNRRYRADSVESDQEHTEAIVRWTAVSAQIQSDGYHDTPNIASVINEITGRDGWAQGNRLCLVLCHDFTGFSQAPYAPDWNEYTGGSTDQFYGCDAGENQPTLTLEWD